VDQRLADYVGGQWPALVRYATVLCGNANEGEELVQSALVRVALRWPFVRDKDNPDGYVRRAVLHGYLNTWRRVRSRETPVADLPEPAGNDSTAVVVDLVTVRAALGALTPKQRAVVVLRYLDDLSERETAQLLGCSTGTVKSQLSKGLARMREVLDVDNDRAVAEPRGGTR
jgi:RNA polymerase sigma-70 factor (sigma-E family)